MQNLYFQKVGSEGVGWVRECLEGGEVFSRMVLSHVDLQGGVVVVAIAIPEHHEAVINHRPLSQGALNVRVVRTEAQAGILQYGLKEIENKYGQLAIVIDENLMYPGDAAAEKIPAEQLYQLKGRYLHIRRLGAIKSAAELARYLSVGWLLNAFIVPEKVIPSDKEIGESDAEKLASSVLGIINFAYDGETYTLWLNQDVAKRVKL